MKALLCTAFGPLEHLAVWEIASPRPGSGQVLIDVKAASLNFPDVLMAQGLYQVKPPLPFSPGTEVAGVVVEAGSEVRGFRTGDRVSAIAGWGGFAEECAVDAGWVTPLPAAMDFETGASFLFTLDPVGGPYTENALRATAWGGRLLVIGFAAGEIPRIPINLALLKERSIVGVYWGDSVKHDPEGHLRNVRQLMEWFADGKVKPSISERVPLGEAAEPSDRLPESKKCAALDPVGKRDGEGCVHGT